MSSSHRSLTQHLRELPDGELVGLLSSRQDLAHPAATDFAMLAQRAHSPTSLARAVETLDHFVLQVLDALRLATDGFTSWTDLPRLAGNGATELEIRRAVRSLTRLAVAWPDEDGVRISPGISEICPPYPAGLGRPLAAMGAEQSLDELLENLSNAPTDAKAILKRLAAGPPIGNVRSTKTRANAELHSPVEWLVAHGLLIVINDQTVELPREVALYLRKDAPLGELKPKPPTLDTVHVEQSALDKGATGNALIALQRAERILVECEQDPPTDLRSGGISLRDLRRIARSILADEWQTALLLEVCHAANLLNKNQGGRWLPTPHYDRWRAVAPAERWSILASAWLEMNRLPGLLGELNGSKNEASIPDTVTGSPRKTAERRLAPLGFELTRHQAPRIRHDLLAVFDELGNDVTAPIAEVTSLLEWRAPRRIPAPGGQVGRMLLESIANEAIELGILAGRRRNVGLSRAGSCLLQGEDASAVLESVFPAPISHIVVQADFTVVAPGPLEPELADEMALVADVESAGGATVYRISPETIRRALDAGRTAAELHDFFGRWSHTPVPQALDYLIDDVARQHGGLRIGAARSYLRSDDEPTLAALLVDKNCFALGLRKIATGVVVSALPPERLASLLESAGYTNALEDATGALVVNERGRPRADDRQLDGVSSMAQPTPVPDGELHELARAIRQRDTADHLARKVSTRHINRDQPENPSTEMDADAVLRVIKEAVTSGNEIWLGFIDPHGGIRRRLVKPLSIGAGYLRASDERTDTTHTFALHRIAWVGKGPQ